MRGRVRVTDGGEAPGAYSVGMLTPEHASVGAVISFGPLKADEWAAVILALIVVVAVFLVSLRSG